MKELDDLKKIFLTDVDEETQADNEAKIREWETALIHNENFASWREHDVTKDILQQARKSFIDISMQLIVADNPALRATLHGRRDAALWLISIINVDAKGAIDQIHQEIRAALSATN